MPQRFDGWTITAILGIGITLASVASLAVLGQDEEGFRFIVRWTGRASTLLFAMSFAASAAFALRRNGATTWLRRNRRYVGVSFAVSQVIHLIALIALGSGSEEFRGGVSMETLVVGGTTYLFTFAMAATSSDAAVRWLGARWRTLHLAGSWWICAVFLLTILPTAMSGAVGAFLSVVLVATLASRFAAWRQRRGARAG